MLSLNERISSLTELGAFISSELEHADEPNSWVNNLCLRAKSNNGWFEKREVLHALSSWTGQLTESNLKDWVSSYDIPDGGGIRIGLVLAGNIPMVGFHDIVSVLISGNKAEIKCSGSDNVIIPALLTKLTDINPLFKATYRIVERLTDYDAILATGSNNSARYFNSYFGSVPNIIRNNRTGIAILDGNENETELNALMFDCFQYFGLGCRNITKLYLPKNYDVNQIFKASMPFAYLMENNKYVNNYTYHKALMMMEKRPVLENELILMINETSLFSPVSVLNYEFYESEVELAKVMDEQHNNIQCVVGRNSIPYGNAQKPKLSDYADNIDTLDFLTKLTAERLPN